MANPPAHAGTAEPWSVDLDRLYRMPLEVYHRIAQYGILGPDDKVELLDGLLVKKMTRGGLHVAVTQLVWEALRGVLPPGWYVQKDDPVALPGGPGKADSEPEPDLSVVRGGIRDYLARKPGPADTALAVEVAESSLRNDRKKLSLYARAGVPVVWIVNLAEGRIEVYRVPVHVCRLPVDVAGYEVWTVYEAGDRVPLALDGREVGSLAVADVLP